MEKEKSVTDLPNIRKLARHIMSLENGDKILAFMKSAVDTMDNGTDEEKKKTQKCVDAIFGSAKP